MNLSDRVRANSEAAPWVVEAIKELEQQLAEREKQIVMLQEVLGEIAGSKSLTATPTQFYQHLQRIASDATMTQDLSGLRLCDGEPVGVVDEYDYALWGDIYTDADVRVGELLYKARKQP